MNRRQFLALSTSAAAIVGGYNRSVAQPSSFTQWGWPQPYQLISDTSIKWLKEKGWWPLAIGNQPAFTGLPAAVGKGFFTARGLEVLVNAFLSGPAINEATVAGRVQAGLEGNFPYTTLLSREFPVRCVAIANPNVKHATLVPSDSPLRSLTDLKTMSDKPSFGIVVGSSAEFYFSEALRSHGLDASKDVILKNMKPTDMLIMPAGLTGFVQWDPYVWDNLLLRKNARQIDSIFDYNFYMGNLWVRSELIENVPDVVQAIVDGYAEGILFTRYDLPAANQVFQSDVMYRGYPPEIINLINDKLNNLYKPNWFFPDQKFWAAENGRVAAWLHQTGRLQKLITPQDYHANFAPQFATETLRKLGWKVPERPCFLPKDWSGTVGKPPYPKYDNEDTLAASQPFPTMEDLERDWMFAGKLYRA
jgi:ABC-type nitrate/sulfonate/bicarbonate transport system substrate-binding protein